MTLTTTLQKKIYTGDGSVTAFAYTWLINTNTDLKVYLRTIATGAESLQTLTTHYTVSGVGSASGGNVTFVSAPASTLQVVIVRAVPLTQTTDYVSNDSFPAEVHESALDTLMMTVQDQGEILDRAIKLSPTNVMTSTEFTQSAADRASKLLSFDASGELAVTQELGTYQGNWSGSSTAYAVRDLIKDTSNNNIYLCNTAHTSSGSQPISSNTDVAKWDLIVNAAAASTSATAAATSATAAATSATAAATSATAAATSATASATSATASATSATASASSATSSASSATTATNYATKVDGAVTGSDFSSKAWSVGGTNVTSTASRGAAKEWSTTTGATVDTSEYSAKEYAIGTTVAVGSAKDWAVLAEDSAVTGSSYSALHHAAKSAASATASAASATAAAASAAGLDHTLDDAVGLIIALG